MTTKQFNEALSDIRNTETFDKFFDEYYPQIIRISTYLYHDEQDARDVAQEIFKYLLTHEAKSYVKNPKAWLFALCRYNGQKLFKKEVPLNEDVEYYEPIQKYMSLDMSTALAKLSAQDVDLIMLVWYYGYSLDEIAAIFRKSYYAVAKQHERIKKKLKKILSN